MLKCILLLPSDCAYVCYCNEIISNIYKIILQSRGRIVHCVVAKRPGGEASWGQTIQVAIHPRVKTSRGRNILVAKRPGANWRTGETSSYLNRLQMVFIWQTAVRLIVTRTVISNKRTDKCQMPLAPSYAFTHSDHSAIIIPRPSLCGRQSTESSPYRWRPAVSLTWDK